MASLGHNELSNSQLQYPIYLHDNLGVLIIKMISFALIKFWISTCPACLRSPIPLMFHVDIRILLTLVVLCSVIPLPCSEEGQTAGQQTGYQFFCVASLLTCLGPKKLPLFSKYIFECSFVNEQKYDFRLKCYRSLFPRVQSIISQHWFR